jgi:hypothetical protein
MLINTIQEHISMRIEGGELSNNDLVQLIEHVGAYLNLKTIPQYAKQHGISYNGAKFRKVIKLFNTKYIIDND